MRLVGDKKPHVFELDFCWTRTDQFSSRHIAKSEIELKMLKGATSPFYNWK